MCVGSGIGPATRAPVRFAVSTMSLADLSRSWWSNARRRIRMVVAEAMMCDPLLDDLGDDARTDGASALADREAHLLLETDRRDELDGHGDVVTRHDHLRTFRQLAGAGHVRRPHVELRTIVREERRVTA